MTKRIGFSLAISIALISLNKARGEEPPRKPDAPAVATAKSTNLGRSVDEARREAALLHTALHSSLQVVHSRYYQEDEGLPLPAATLKDVFAEIKEAHGIELHWLAVEGQAMNTDHKPRDAFEKEAVESLKSGRRDFEKTENGVYRRAGAITLGNHCLKCHVPDRKSTQDRTAGLIIAIPLE